LKTSHPGIEILTNPRGGAVQIVRFCSAELFNEFQRRHLIRKRLGPWNSLELVYLKHEDAQEDVLVVSGPEPELHIHGGEANFEALLLKLNSLTPEFIGKSPKQIWREAWEATFKNVHGDKGLRYMLNCWQQQQTVEGSNLVIHTPSNYDQEGWEYLRPIKMCLVGPPNAGKSTFFNELLGEQRALVSHLAGTTRDLLQASIILDGWEVLLTDTAGFDPDTIDDNTLASPTILGTSASPNTAEDLLQQPDLCNNGVHNSITQQSERLALQCLQQADIVLAFRCQLPQTLAPKATILPIYSKCEDGGASLGQWPISVHQKLGWPELMQEVSARLRQLKGQNISPRFHRDLL
jgi:hypothetical protein